MQDHRNDKIIVRFDPNTCIHSGECIRGLPAVFNLSKDPWIDV
ncbi:MAG: (4Fe-4S)-binding protein, partial [Gammaproteobacteria bacterium]